MKVALAPTATLWLCGWVVMLGATDAGVTVSASAPLVALPPALTASTDRPQEFNASAHANTLHASSALLNLRNIIPYRRSADTAWRHDLRAVRAKISAGLR